MALAATASFGQNVPGFGAPAKRDKSGNELVKASIVVDERALGERKPFLVGVNFTIEKDWHIYWKNSGQSGSATVVKLSLPEGFTAGPLQWPRPVAHRAFDELTYVYEDSVVLFSEVTPPKEWAGGPVEVKAEVSWLVCKEACLRGSASLQATLSAAPSGGRDALEKARARVPKPFQTLPDAAVSFDGRTLRLEGPAQKSPPTEFFPDDHPAVAFGEAQIATNGGRFVVEIPVTLSPQNAQGRELRVGGVVVFGPKPDDGAFEIDVPAVPTRH